MLLMFAPTKPLSCLNLMLLEVDLNLLVLQRGNLLMFYALLPLLLTVRRWMLDFPANGVNPRNLNLAASFPLVGDPGKACKVLWDTTSSCRVNLRLECSLVAIVFPLLRLRLTFINPNKHFAAILERILL